MWGNRLGWGISGVIVLLAVFVVYWVEASLQISPPTQWYSNIPALRTPGDVGNVVPDMTDTGDAGPMYRRAIQDYEAHADDYAALQDAPGSSFDLAAAANKPAVKAMLAATKVKTMTLFADHPQDVVRYDERPHLRSLEAVAKLTTKVALFTGLKKPADAAKYYDAIFALGCKLYQERVVFDELFLGLGLMGEATDGLASVAEKSKDPARATSLKEFNEARKDYAEKTVLPVWQVISSISDDTIATHAGDMFALAKASPDKVWQIEAILKLGRMKYNTSRRGDQDGARRTLRQLVAESHDLAVKQAATLANELTIEQYRMLK